MEENNLQNNPQIRPISTSDWMVTTLVAAIPVVGFIMLFVWGFSDNTAESKKNWARATLIWMAIGIVLSVLIIFVFGLGTAMFAGAVSGD